MVQRKRVPKSASKAREAYAESSKFAMAHSPHAFTIADPIEALVPIWQESLFAIDLLLLLSSPVFFGSRVPRGTGAPVLLLPGFTHGDAYLIVLYNWLHRMGYRPYFSGITINADCPDLLVREIVAPTLIRAHRVCRRKVHLIGHSFGGIIARSLAAQYPKEIASVITLGTPFQRSMVHKEILEEADIVRRYILIKHGDAVLPQCYTPLCPCDFMTALRRQTVAPTRFTSIYTATDGVIDWASCRTGDPRMDVQVRGTHAGLVFNPEVYRVIAQRLARASRTARTKRSERVRTTASGA